MRRGCTGALRDEDDVGCGRNPREKSDPSGVAAHELDDHDTVVGLGRRVESSDGIGRRGDRRVKSKSDLRRRQIVVDRFGHSNDGEPLVEKCGSDPERPVSADRDERVQPPLPKQVDDLVGAVHEIDGAVIALDGPAQRIAPIGGPEDGSPDVRDAAYRLPCQIEHPVILEEPLISPPDSKYPPSEVASRKDDGPYDRVEAGCIAAARVDCDLHVGCRA